LSFTIQIPPLCAVNYIFYSKFPMTLINNLVNRFFVLVVVDKTLINVIWYWKQFDKGFIGFKKNCAGLKRLKHIENVELHSRSCMISRLTLFKSLRYCGYLLIAGCQAPMWCDYIFHNHNHNEWVPPLTHNHQVPLH